MVRYNERCRYIEQFFPLDTPAFYLDSQIIWFLKSVHNISGSADRSSNRYAINHPSKGYVQPFWFHEKI